MGSDFQDPSGFGEQPHEGLTLPPWEERQRYGFLNALYLTIKDALLAPAPFFKRMPTRIGIIQPLLFALVVGVIGSFFEWMWSLTGSSLQMFVAEDVSDVLEGPLMFGLLFVLSPAITCVHVFVGAGIIHLCLMLVGGNRLGFEATFRVVAYAMAASLLLIVPVCGSLLFPIWSLVVMVIGLHKIHDIEPWRAIIAVLLPLLLCSLSCALTGWAFVGLFHMNHLFP